MNNDEKKLQRQAYWAEIDSILAETLAYFRRVNIEAHARRLVASIPLAA